MRGSVFHSGAFTGRTLDVYKRQGLMYVLGAVAVGLIVPAEVLSGNFSNGIFDVFQILAAHFGIPNGVIVRLVGVILLLGRCV